MSGLVIVFEDVFIGEVLEESYDINGDVGVFVDEEVEDGGYGSEIYEVRVEFGSSGEDFELLDFFV